MSDDDKDRLTDVDRRSMRILARSTKASGPANARVAERLERAAGSGNRGDYRRAEESFDALPPRERHRIGTHAERQAETERQLIQARKSRPTEPKVAKPAQDDTLDWKPLVVEHSPAADPTDGQAWKLGRPIDGPAGQAAPAVPKPSTPKPAAAGAAPGRRNAAAPPAGAKRPLLTVEPAVEKKPPDDADNGWDWQRIPEDPILKAKRKKAAVDPIEELRRQMLGDDSKSR